jgi:uncharacterized protein
MNSRYNSSHIESRQNIICPEEQMAWLKGLVNFTDSETCLLAKFADSLKQFLNVKRLIPYQTISTERHFYKKIVFRMLFIQCRRWNAR